MRVLLTMTQLCAGAGFWAAVTALARAAGYSWGHVFFVLCGLVLLLAIEAGLREALRQ
jgi:hypothetical protein